MVIGSGWFLSLFSGAHSLLLLFYQNMTQYQIFLGATATASQREKRNFKIRPFVRIFGDIEIRNNHCRRCSSQKFINKLLAIFVLFLYLLVFSMKFYVK